MPPCLRRTMTGTSVVAGSGRRVRRPYGRTMNSHHPCSLLQRHSSRRHAVRRYHPPMLRARVLAAIVLLAAATSAVAEDPPGLALAKKMVEENRGDEHRAKMRIVWPEGVETAPPEGAEVTL